MELQRQVIVVGAAILSPVAGYFERAYAEEMLGNQAAAEADYKRIIETTEPNRNLKERATMYAKLADLSARSGDSTRPKYSNNSEQGRAKNRRVELGMNANDQMISDAQDGEIG